MNEKSDVRMNEVLTVGLCIQMFTTVHVVSVTI